MKLKLILVLTLFSLTVSTYCQQPIAWTKWEGLFGDWIGEGGGKPGQGGGTFTFKPDLDNKILVRKGHTEFPATDKSPVSVHDDLMIISPDHSGTPAKAIYFDNEGHIINYSITYAEKSIILTSEKVPGSPVFRLTYSLLDPETMNTQFEVSQDGVSFRTYIQGKSKKLK